MLVVKKNKMEIRAQKYLASLSEGRSEIWARAEAEGASLVSAILFMTPSLSVLTVSIALSKIYGSSEFGEVGWVFAGSALSLLTLGPMSNLFYKSQSRKYSQENLLAHLTPEDKVKALELISAHNKRLELEAEYKKSPSEFLIKYVGECNKEMLYDTREIVEKNPKLILNFSDPESAEYKKIKPQAKIFYKV